MKLVAFFAFALVVVSNANTEAKTVSSHHHRPNKLALAPINQPNHLEEEGDDQPNHDLEEEEEAGPFSVFAQRHPQAHLRKSRKARRSCMSDVAGVRNKYLDPTNSCFFQVVGWAAKKSKIPLLAMSLQGKTLLQQCEQHGVVGQQAVKEWCGLAIHDNPTPEIHLFCRNANQANIVGFDNNDEYIIGCHPVPLRSAVSKIDVLMQGFWRSFTERFVGKKIFEHYSGTLSDSLKGVLFGKYLVDVAPPLYLAPGDVTIDEFLKRHPYIQVQSKSDSKCVRSAKLGLDAVSKPSHPCFIDVVIHYIHEKGLENIIGLIRANALVDQCKIEDGAMDAVMFSEFCYMAVPTRSKANIVNLASSTITKIVPMCSTYQIQDCEIDNEDDDCWVTCEAQEQEEEQEMDVENEDEQEEQPENQDEQQQEIEESEEESEDEDEDENQDENQEDQEDNVPSQRPAQDDLSPAKIMKLTANEINRMANDPFSYWANSKRPIMVTTKFTPRLWYDLYGFAANPAVDGEVEFVYGQN